jgi:hypothetical protein
MEYEEPIYGRFLMAVAELFKYNLDLVEVQEIGLDRSVTTSRRT